MQSFNGFILQQKKILRLTSVAPFRVGSIALLTNKPENTLSSPENAMLPTLKGAMLAKRNILYIKR